MPKRQRVLPPQADPPSPRDMVPHVIKVTAPYEWCSRCGRTTRSAAAGRQQQWRRQCPPLPSFQRKLNKGTFCLLSGSGNVQLAPAPSTASLPVGVEDPPPDHPADLFQALAVLPPEAVVHRSSPKDHSPLPCPRVLAHCETIFPLRHRPIGHGLAHRVARGMLKASPRPIGAGRP